ncbi:MAG TPA: sensor histidine kinase [Bryobacterales bacterium]|jgi:signal transduction histidine kinase|nr:sensor histidine kinase [Bryobacterales bacterium]
MSALAFAPAPATRHRPEAAQKPALVDQDQPLLIRFDSSGEIQWMNDAAREALRGRSSVLAVLASEKPLPPLSRHRLGAEWLWLGISPGDWGARFRQRLGEVDRWLAECLWRRSSVNVNLIRAQAVLQRYSRPDSGKGAPRQAAETIAELEAERGRIARELHDDAGQSLAGVIVNLELAQRHLDSANSEAMERLARSRSLAASALDQIRRISRNLLPPEWGDLDFGAAVENLLENMGARARLDVETGPLELPAGVLPALKTTLYRTLQEGITNALRHSGATRLRIHASAPPGRVVLVLEDNGRGFDPRAAAGNKGIGLRNIRQRIESFGGSLEIAAAPQHGVRLTICAPIPPKGK